MGAGRAPGDDGSPAVPRGRRRGAPETFRCLNGEAVPGGVERVRRPWPSPRQMMADALKRIDVATAFPWLQFLVITLDGHDVGLQRQWLGAIARIAVGPRPPVDWRAWRLSRVQIDSLRWICRVPNPTSEILDWPQSFKDRILHSVGLPSVEETTAWIEAMPRRAEAARAFLNGELTLDEDPWASLDSTSLIHILSKIMTRIYQSSDLSTKRRELLDAARSGYAQIRDRDGMGLVSILQVGLRGPARLLVTLVEADHSRRCI